jgi:hypothetical protein
MRSKEITILLAAVALLGAFIYFYERHTIGTEEKSQRADRILPDFNRDKVTRLEVSSTKGTFAIERREAGKEKKEKGMPGAGKPQHRWVMVSPFAAAADPSVVDGLLSDIEFMAQERKVEGEPARKKAKFGLDKPRVTVKISMGARQVKLVVGKEAPGEGLYLGIAGKDDVVYVVSMYTIESFMKSPSDVRDRQLLDLLAAQVKDITIFKGDAVQARFEKAGGKWTATAAALGGSPARVSRKEVEALAAAVGALQATSFIADKADPARLARYGLEGAATRVVLNEEGGRKEEILFGGPCGGETKGTEGIAALVKGSGTLACVGLDVKTRLEKPVTDYALQTAVEFDEYDLVAFEGYDGDALTVRLESSDETWKITRPDPSEADAETVIALLDALRNEKATAVVRTESELAAAGFTAAPKARLVFYGMDGTVMDAIALAWPSSGKMYFQRGGESAWHEMAGGPAIRDAHRPFHYYKKAVIEEDYYASMSFSVESRTGQLRHTLVKNEADGKWKFEQPQSLVPDPSDVRDTIESFASLTAQRFLAAKSPQAMAQYGLSDPAWTLKAVFSAPEGEGEESRDESAEKKPRPRTLLVGIKVEDGYAALLEQAERPAIFLLTDTAFKRLTRPLASRDVFQVDRERIETITLEKGKQAETFTPSAGGFGHAEGAMNLFDPAKVGEFIDKLGLLRAGDVVGYGPPGAATGLAAPVLKVVFDLKAAAAAGEGTQPTAAEEKTLVFGAKVKAGEGEPGVYAAVAGTPCTYTVGLDVLEALGLQP